MKIIPLIDEIYNKFCNVFQKSLTPLNIESNIRDVGDNFTIKLYENFLNFFDEQFKNSKARKANYYVKKTRQRTLITSVGSITVNCTSYISKQDKHYYVPIRDVLHLKSYQRLTNEAEYQLIKYTMDENMSQSAKHALRNTIVSRSTVSKKISALKGSINEKIERATEQPDILYIEMDEIHANLQKGGNKICPCTIVHEGYKEDFAKRKVLKNIHYFASAELTYEQLWEVIFDYVDKRYDIQKFKTIFISGNGASGIKNYKNCFPNAKFVLDIFHYIRKHLNYIFKYDNDLKNIADDYIRNDKIDDFKKLVDIQISKYPTQENIKDAIHYIYNIDEIENLKDFSYAERYAVYLIKNMGKLCTYNKNDNVIKDGYANKFTEFSGVSEMQLLKLLQEKKSLIAMNDTHKVNDVASVCYAILEEISQIPNYLIKRCQNCGRYFIPNKRLDEIYCDYTKPNGKTCREQGAILSYNKRLQDKSAYSEYRRQYQQKFTYMNKNKEDKQIKKDFKNWKKQAKEKIFKVKHNKISEDEVFAWLEKHK